MFKTIKEVIIKIILLFCISIPLLIFSYFLDENGNIKSYNLLKEIEFNIHDEEYVEVEENIDVDVLSIGFDTLNIPLACYVGNDNTSNIKDFEVYLNNNKLGTKSIATNYEIYQYTSTIYNLTKQNDYMRLHIEGINKNPIYINQKEYSVKIKYKCSVNDIFKEYNNVTIATILKNKSFKKLNVNFNFYKEVEEFNIDYLKSDIKKIDNKKYSVNLSKIKYLDSEPSINIMMDKGIFSNIKTVNETYDKLNYQNQYKENLKIRYGSSIKYLTYIIVVEILLIIILFFKTRKPKIKKGYISNPESVIDPILAESIIDRKIR